MIALMISFRPLVTHDEFCLLVPSDFNFNVENIDSTGQASPTFKHSNIPRSKIEFD